MTMRPSWATFKYYHGYIKKYAAEHIGFESPEEAHDHFIAGFYRLNPSGPLPSMAEMDQEEASRFLDFVIRQCAEMGIVLGDPERKR